MSKQNTELVDAIFSIIEQTNPNRPIDQINRLRERAQNDVSTYHTEMKGLKGLYARLHSGWIFQTALFFVSDIVATKIVAWKHNQLIKLSKPSSDDDFDLEDDF